MLKSRIVNSLPDKRDAPRQSLLGLAALAAEMAAEGISVDALFNRTGVDARQLDDPMALISHRQRLAIYRNAVTLSKRSDVALLAGTRQRISDFGIYGYAMLTSPTFGDALDMSLTHITMAGPMVPQISFSIENGLGILRSHGLASLGDMLPFVAEFWRSSITSLFSHVLGMPFPSKRMRFTFPPPVHWRHYGRLFNCPIEFGAEAMEWHFSASVLDQPCPNANPITSQVCQQFCDRVMAERPGEADLASAIRAACINSARRFPTAAEIAPHLGLSLRTLHRRLAHDGLSYQAVIDDLRRSLAIEFLENTRMAVDQIAERIGFADATSFRKALRKWTGQSPRDFRREV